MKNVLLLAPLYGNGGIASWTKKFIKSFPNKEYGLIPVSVVALAKNNDANILERIYKGFSEIRAILYNVECIFKSQKVDILHTTTSGSLGSWRDLFVGRLCNKYKVKSIMHCRYGCIPLILQRRGIGRWIMVKSMEQFNQVWVLDRKSFDALYSIQSLKEKVRLTPNSIVVNPLDSIPAKPYKNYVFMANILKTKGILELIEAFKKVEDKSIYLHILGPSTPKMNEKMKVISGDLWNNRIKYYGRMENDATIEFLKSMDVMVLPTYYSGEAFPISILEAMSNGKLVISTPRAAIGDMLTCVDGSRCGILVDEKSINQLVDAINWVCEHKTEADNLCKKAYEKVLNAYSTDVVYGIYRKNYSELFN